MSAALSSTTRMAIDGSTLEGGGQILRNSISLSALLGIPLTVHKIRNGRKPPGLKNQHRTGLQLVSNISSGNLVGAANGSTSVTFDSGLNWQDNCLPGTWEADPQTAGSVMLLLQISLPLILFIPSREPSPSTLILRGGTNASNAPQLDYTTNVFLPFIHRHFGAPIVNVHVNSRGYYPRGGGCVNFTVFSPLPRGVPLKNVHLLEQGHVLKIEGISHLAGLPNVVGKDMVKGALNILNNAGFNGSNDRDEKSLDENETPTVPISITTTRFPPGFAPGAGSGIVLYATLSSGAIIGGSALGGKGKTPASVGEEAAKELVNNLKNGGVVDEWLQDQVILFMALANGRSEINIGRNEPTLHTQSAIWVAEQLTNARFSTNKNEANHIIISCEGIGYNSNDQGEEITP